MSRGALSWRMALWVTFVGVCALAMANAGIPPGLGFGLGPFHVYPSDLLLAVALVFALGDMGRAVIDPEPSIKRTIVRILLAYLLYEVIVVLPVGIGLGASANAVVRTMQVRFIWLLVPTVWALCDSDRLRGYAGAVPVIAAAGLAAWGLYSAATGGAGFYYESGDLRYRVLWGGSTLLFAWPLVLAAAGAVSRRLTPALVGLALVGLTLTNHRSGLVAFALASLFCVVASGAWRRVVVWAVPTTLGLIVVGLLAEAQIKRVFGFTFGELLDFGSGNGADRLMRWRLAWQMFTTRPINDYVWSWSYYLVYLRESYGPHNVLLEIATREGLAGLAFYGSIIWTALRAGWAWVRRDALVRALAGYLIAFITFAMGNMTLTEFAIVPLLVAAVAAIGARVSQLRAADIGDAIRPAIPAEGRMSRCE